MKYSLFTASLFAIGVVAASGAAQAQSTDIDATAIVTKLDSPIEFLILEHIDFDEVNKPNGTRAGNKCRYQLGASITEAGAYRAEEIDSNGSVVDNAIPTPSRCGWGESDSIGGTPMGVMGAYCEAGLEMQVDASFISAGLQGVEFSRPAGLKSLAFFDGVSGDIIRDTFGTSMTETCREAEGYSGLLGLIIGGQLIIDETALETAEDVQVGTVTLDFSY